MAKRSDIALNLLQKIRAKKAKVAILGLGYVGLPMARELVRHGFSVFGIDTDRERINAIRKGISFIADLSNDELRHLLRNKRFSVDFSFRSLSLADVVLICVPTPLNKTQDPDLSYIISATREIRSHLHRGQLIILESTTYPGTTEEVVLTGLRRNGFQVGRDFFLCFSPERIDPGNRKFKTRDIPKVVGGVTPACSRLGADFYRTFLKKVVPVSSPRAAEMTKLLENTFRIVNIGLINELAIVARALNIDIWEVIEAASTKPFGFMPFYPGPGVGGHCIGIDPVYLAWKAKHHGEEVQFVDLARRVNARMPEYIVERIVFLFNQELKKKIFGAKILVLGVTYKKDVPDVRESPAFEIMSRLEQLGAHVTYHDPYVPELRNDRFVWRSQRLDRKGLRRQDLVLLLTDHTKFNRKLIVQEAKAIFDARNALNNFRSKKICKL